MGIELIHDLVTIKNNLTNCRLCKSCERSNLENLVKSNPYQSCNNLVALRPALAA
jgi:hypothetical protein